ncbi:Cupin domain [Legionella steigerwaltii]|uniref:Cupin domain n=1 Tax=Legionella steigerwaltii TaxID=460 RepID=A0A378LK33_9GAMM|nr:cupin domain-containing protein [Legionella steigerwaltii]KTD77802.1 Cupin domain protein [Legionella steigerwaltii]STY24441.1 Cupin domain [Legionella steigerwaltii]
MKNVFRCVVTGKRKNGKSFICDDKKVSMGPLGIFDFWATDQMPAPMRGDNILDGIPTRLEPPPNGTVFRYFVIPPVEKNLSPQEADLKAQAVFATAGASHCRVDTRLNPMMHTTKSIDYVVILKGEVTLLLDEGEIKLKPFDAVVQRGTNHYWINNSTEPALLLGVLVDAKENQ